MHIQNGTTKGDIRFTEDTEIRGIVAGNVRVNRNVFIDVKGIIAGDLELEPGSKVNLGGTVNGDVTNNGGTLEITGTVSGDLLRHSGLTTVAENAKVLGRAT